jgi:formamidopyrimidine-DNA glycosylase
MPELPEVESVRAGLEKHVIGWKILRARNLHPRALSRRSIAPLKSLENRRISAIKRRGKFLWFEFDGSENLVLLAHLGMSGQFRIEGNAFEIGKTENKGIENKSIESEKRSRDHRHRRAYLELGRNCRVALLNFHDQRTFGWLRVDMKRQEVPDSILHIASDIFDPSFNREALIAKLSKKKRAIKPALLDQSDMSGVGNIYADEALWRSRIHPERLCDSITEEEYRELLKSLRVIFRRAIRAGGTSFDQLYINVNGESGYFENSLEAYGREGEPCSRCGTLITRIKFANRSSHFCRYCQRK